jgi:hypothetical protein
MLDHAFRLPADGGWGVRRVQWQGESRDSAILTARLLADSKTTFDGPLQPTTPMRRRSLQLAASVSSTRPRSRSGLFELFGQIKRARISAGRATRSSSRDGSSAGALLC